MTTIPAIEDEDTSAAEISFAPDRLLRAILPSHALRVVVTTTTEVAREAAARHGAVGGPAAALARAATAGLLLATLTKDRERLTAELSGGGPLGSLLVDANGAGEVRVYLRNPGTPITVVPGAHVPLGAALGSTGIVRVARDLGLRETVTGQTPLVDGEIDTDLEHYLVSSEQVPSALGCEALLGPGLDVVASGGVLLQTLPGSDALPVLEQWRADLRAGALTRALQGQSGAAADPLVLLHALIAQHPQGRELAEDLVVLSQSSVRFHCPCSKARALATLGVLTAQDLREMVAEGNGAEVTCEFCRARHLIAPPELAEQLARKLAEDQRTRPGGARPS